MESEILDIQSKPIISDDETILPTVRLPGQPLRPPKDFFEESGIRSKPDIQEISDGETTLPIVRLPGPPPTILVHAPQKSPRQADSTSQQSPPILSLLKQGIKKSQSNRIAYFFLKELDTDNVNFENFNSLIEKYSPNDSNVKQWLAVSNVIRHTPHKLAYSVSEKICNNILENHEISRLQRSNAMLHLSKIASRTGDRENDSTHKKEWKEKAKEYGIRAVNMVEGDAPSLCHHTHALLGNTTIEWPEEWPSRLNALSKTPDPALQLKRPAYLQFLVLRTQDQKFVDELLDISSNMGSSDAVKYYLAALRTKNTDDAHTPDPQIDKHLNNAWKKAIVKSDAFDIALCALAKHRRLQDPHAANEDWESRLLENAESSCQFFHAYCALASHHPTSSTERNSYLDSAEFYVANTPSYYRKILKLRIGDAPLSSRGSRYALSLSSKGSTRMTHSRKGSDSGLTPPATPTRSLTALSDDDYLTPLSVAPFGDGARNWRAINDWASEVDTEPTPSKISQGRYATDRGMRGGYRGSRGRGR